MPRLMDTYDPNWKQRYNVLSARFWEYIAATRNDMSLEVRQKTKWLIEEIDFAHFARHRTVADYESKMRQSAQNCASEDGCLLPWPELNDDATREDVDATYEAYKQSVSRVRAFKSIPAPVEWDEPVFRSKLPNGVTRTIEDRVFPLCDAAGSERLVVEWHPGHVHVCLIHTPTSLWWAHSWIRSIAMTLQSEITPRARMQWWQRRISYPLPAITFYSYLPKFIWGATDQVTPLTFEWDGERYGFPKKEAARPVPPIIFSAALDTDPVLKWLLGSLVKEPVS